MLVCHDPVGCVAFFNVRHNCPYGTTGLGDMIIGSLLLNPVVNRLGLVRCAVTSQARFFCVSNGLGDCQFNRLLKAVMEKFAVVFAKITQNRKVWTAHLGAIHERDISGLQLH
jgi:hypothetical protein